MTDQLEHNWDAWAADLLGIVGLGRVAARAEIARLFAIGKSVDEDDLALQQYGNEDAQTPGNGEGEDSEAVTADHDRIANGVVDGIEADLASLGLGLAVLDNEVRGEIREHWLKIVRGALHKVAPVHTYKFAEPNGVKSGAAIMSAVGDPEMLSDAELSSLLRRLGLARASRHLTLIEDVALRFGSWQLARERRRRSS